MRISGPSSSSFQSFIARKSRSPSQGSPSPPSFCISSKLLHSSLLNYRMLGKSSFLPPRMRAFVLFNLVFMASVILSAPTTSPPGKRTHYICGKTDPFCQFYEVCDVAIRPNCPCLDRAGPGEPIFTHGQSAYL